MISDFASQVPHIISALQPVVDQYGYVAVGLIVMAEGFGVPAPGMTIIIVAAFFAGLGQLSLILVALVAFFGALVGDSIGFFIGKFAGEPLAKRYGKYIFLTPKRLEKASAYFKQKGGRIILVARFIDGLRQVNGIIAGLSEMRWLHFLMFNAIGAAAWVATWSLAGYFGGRHIQLFIRLQLYLFIAAALAIVGLITYKALKKRHISANN